MRFLGRRHQPPPPVIGRGEIRRMFEGWEPERLVALHRRRVERYLPIWFAVHPILADAAELSDEKRDLHRLRMTELLDRVDGLMSGERLVKARLNETESAISTVTNGIRARMPAEPWSERARNAALTARHHLQFVGARESGYAAKLAGAVYVWAEIETGFQGDTASLLQRLTPEERRPGPHDDYHDHQHLLYGRPAQQAGLGKQGLAVYAEVARIMQSLDDNLEPFVVDASFWKGAPSPAARQRAEAYRDFHGKPPPPWGA
jgi:hypothetical protein